jgi:hypothetical protein
MSGFVAEPRPARDSLGKNTAGGAKHLRPGPLRALTDSGFYDNIVGKPTGQ